MSYTIEGNIFYFDRPVVSITKTGKVALTESVKRVLYQAIIEQNHNQEICAICIKPRIGRIKLTIDHIKNTKPLESEKNSIVKVVDYQLLCISCNTIKQRNLEKTKASKTPKLYTASNASSKTLKPTPNGITHTYREKENRTIDSNRLSKKLKQSFINTASAVLTTEGVLLKKDLINYSLALCFQKGIILSWASAVNYIEPFINTPRKYGGLFQTKDDDYLELIK